jgi:hypothetical protein
MRFVVTVSGMTTTGTVIAAIAAGAGFDAAGNPTLASTSIDNVVTYNQPGITAVGAGAGFEPRVNVFDGLTNALKFSFLAYEAHFLGGVSVAVGDVNNDGTDDIITGAGFLGGPHVKVFDGKTATMIHSFYAYTSDFVGGVSVAAGDVNNDGIVDIITGAGLTGGPHVKVFNGMTLAEIHSFFAYALNHTGGISVASGDVNNDGVDDIITGASLQGGSQVKIFDGTTAVEFQQTINAYQAMFADGIYVAAVDLNNDGFDDIIVGPGVSSPERVRFFNGQTFNELQNITPYAADFTGGIRVAAGDPDQDGRVNVVTGPGPTGGPHVKKFDGVTLAEESFFAFDTKMTNGIFVAVS